MHPPKVEKRMMPFPNVAAATRRPRGSTAFVLVAILGLLISLVAGPPCAVGSPPVVPKSGGSTAAAKPGGPPLLPGERATLERISADSLRGHVSFLASDALEGRDTPSRGLDIAAEYIAAQFRRAGLKTAGDDGYFQTARWRLAESDPANFSLSVENGGNSERLALGAEQVSVFFSDALTIERAEVRKIAFNDIVAREGALAPGALSGKAVVTEYPNFVSGDRARNEQLFRARTVFLNRVRAAGALLVVSLDRTGARGIGLGAATRLIDPDAAARPLNQQTGQQQQRGNSGGVPLLTVHSPAFVRFHDALPSGGDTGRAVVPARARADRAANHAAQRRGGAAGLRPGPARHLRARVCTLRPSGRAANRRRRRPNSRRPHLQWGQRRRERHGGRDRVGPGACRSQAAPQTQHRVRVLFR
jgi:hypothetical protein